MSVGGSGWARFFAADFMAEMFANRSVSRHPISGSGSSGERRDDDYPSTGSSITS
jgi:hypothetical protein